jgi:hypothetical protein
MRDFERFFFRDKYREFKKRLYPWDVLTRAEEIEMLMRKGNIALGYEKESPPKYKNLAEFRKARGVSI